MVIIKGVCFHASIEVIWIITFFYTEIIDLKILEVIALAITMSDSGVGEK